MKVQLLLWKGIFVWLFWYTDMFDDLNRKKAHTTERNSMLSATSLVTRLEDLYHQNLIVTMHISWFEWLPGYCYQSPVNKWNCGAAPITAMMTVKRWARGPGASNIGKPVAHPATVDLSGKAYELLRQNTATFLMDDIFRNLGPLQFDGPGSDTKTMTLCVEDQDYMGRLKLLQDYLDKKHRETRMLTGCSESRFEFNGFSNRSSHRNVYTMNWL